MSKSRADDPEYQEARLRHIYITAEAYAHPHTPPHKHRHSLMQLFEKKPAAIVIDDEDPKNNNTKKMTCFHFSKK